MTISRVLLLVFFAALLGSCTAATSLPQAQESVSTKMAQADVTQPAKMKSKTKSLEVKAASSEAEGCYGISAL